MTLRDPSATTSTEPIEGSERSPAAHLSLDPTWSRLTVIEFGSVWDGQPDELFVEHPGEERLLFLLSEPGGSIVGFAAHEPHELDPEAFEDPGLWEHPRFNVPLLGMPNASVGEILLAVQARFDEEEPTADVMFFHMAIQAAHEDDDLVKAAWCWRVALEAGDMKARFGLGYTLVDLGEFREAYDHLRIYTDLTPSNAWAWCWLGKACEGLGEAEEAASAYRRAIKLEQEGGFETDAPDRLASLLG